MNTTEQNAKMHVEVKAVYRHFVEGLMQVVKVVEHSQTGEKLVLLSAFSNPAIWKVCPLDEFISEVETDEGTKPRYAKTDLKIGTIGGLFIGG